MVESPEKQSKEILLATFASSFPCHANSSRHHSPHFTWVSSSMKMDYSLKSPEITCLCLLAIFLCSGAIQHKNPPSHKQTPSRAQPGLPNTCGLLFSDLEFPPQAEHPAQKEDSQHPLQVRMGCFQTERNISSNITQILQLKQARAWV